MINEPVVVMLLVVMFEIVGAVVSVDVANCCVVNVKFGVVVELPSASTDVTLKLYVVLAERPERVVECVVVFVVLSRRADERP